MEILNTSGIVLAEVVGKLISFNSEVHRYYEGFKKKIAVGVRGGLKWQKVLISLKFIGLEPLYIFGTFW